MDEIHYPGPSCGLSKSSRSFVFLTVVETGVEEQRNDL